MAGGGPNPASTSSGGHSKKRKHKYEYDSDEETEGGTWEHKKRREEMEKTAGKLTVILTVSFSGTVLYCSCMVHPFSPADDVSPGIWIE